MTSVLLGFYLMIKVNIFTFPKLLKLYKDPLTMLLLFD